MNHPQGDEADHVLRYGAGGGGGHGLRGLVLGQPQDAPRSVPARTQEELIRQFHELEPPRDLRGRGRRSAAKAGGGRVFEEEHADAEPVAGAQVANDEEQVRKRTSMHDG